MATRSAAQPLLSPADATSHRLLATRVHAGPAGQQTRVEERDGGALVSGRTAEDEQSAGVRAALSALRFYKRQISPLLPPGCRFLPTCSEYSMGAFSQHGVRKGFILTAWRLLKCNPLGPSGYDPVRWPPPGLDFVFKE